MASTTGVPPSPWEADEEPRADDPVKLLSDLLLGRAGQGPLAAREIRLSSGLVLGGVCLGLGGFAGIALAQLGGGDLFGLRELGGVLGGAGLLVLLWGILLGLPAHRGLRVLGLGGAVIAALGIAAFAWAYPEQWGRGAVDHSVTVLGTYMAGLVLLVAATFGSLVADFVLRMQVKGRLRGQLGREPTDAEISADIDEAFRRHRVTWGGVTADEGKAIKVKAEAMPLEFQNIKWKLGREKTSDGTAELDLSVNKLLEFRGGRNRRGEAPEAGVGDAVDALRALRVAKEQAPKPTFWDKLLGRTPKWEPPGSGPGPRGP